jgi:uncharacterized protein
MSTSRDSRRQFLGHAGLVAVSALAPPGFRGLEAQAASAAAPGAGADYFSLAQVQLGEGPFLHAQKLDAAYLLRLEPDRMLHNFRVNAGLTPKAPVYGGWESVEPWIDIRCHGHTLGHYLSAIACMYETTGDARFAERVDYIVAELAECQEKTSGWLTAFPDGVAPLVDSFAGGKFAGVPWYTTHKVLAGLRDAYRHRQSRAALAVLTRFADWIDRSAAGVPAERFEKMLDREHGGMNEVLADLFAITRERRYLDLALRFSHQALLAPLAAGRDTLDGLHANTQIPKVIGFERLAEVSGSASHGAAAKYFWDVVVNQRSFATGGHGDGEHFFPARDFASHLSSAKTMETCCTHNMMRLTRALYSRDPRVAYFDYFERALFNGILASQDPVTGMNTYFQATRPGYVRLYHTEFDSFWCCTGSGIENHARYGESIYAFAGSTLFVNLFLSSTLDWTDRKLKFRQETRFPDSDTTRITLLEGTPRRLTLAIRQPGWCPLMTVTVRGQTLTARRPGEYFRFSPRLRAGDSIDVSLPMSLALEPLPQLAGGAPEWGALRYGPIVLAARLGTTGLTPGAQLIVNERESGKMLNDAAPIPVWPKLLAQLPESLERLPGENLAFVARGFAGTPSADGRVEFAPYFRLYHERYNLYWRSGAA